MPTPGEFAHVPLTHFLPPDLDLRDRTTAEYLDYFHHRLVPDVRERGIQVPVICYRTGDGFPVIDGWTRTLAGLIAQVQTAPALVYPHPPTADEIDDARAQANELRLDLSDRDRVAEWLRTMRKRNWSQAELCRRRKLDKSSVCRLLKRYGVLPADLLADVGGSIPARAADALARLHDQPAVMRELADQVRNGLLCVEALEEKVKALLGGKARTARPQTVSDGGVKAVFPAAWTELQIFEWLTRTAKKFRPKTA